ncbi:enoyl-CoA hydratase/isomerase family protein [bacterium LRH843]|nr:enoyl-CoA hydratase/isomerase family protein [bacterium LRH843]
MAEVKNGVGWIRLNRPNVLNSINVEVVEIIYEALEEWKNNEEVALICMYGEGEKGLCAGGDMRKFYDLRVNGVEAYAEEFFTKEYQMDYEIHHYPKPIVIYMNGVVMGGGVGLSVGATHRIATEKTKWAMPEMNIGFFPDVGASYFLNKMPGFAGRYLALTAQVIQASDALYSGVADYYLDSKNWQALKNDMIEKTWTSDSATSDLSQLLKRHCTTSSASSTIALLQEKIDHHFQYDTIEEIVSSLKEVAESDEWAEQTMTILLSKSPTSLKVTLRQLKEGKHKSLQECFEMEKKMAIQFMKCSDFYEGVRSVLVDKDRSPKWNPSTLADVKEEEIIPFFDHKV